MKRLDAEFFTTLAIFCALLLAVIVSDPREWSSGDDSSQLAAVSIVSPFVYSFNASGVLHEAARMSESTSPYWWINSGGTMIMAGGLGKTTQGEAPLLDRWRIAYALTNPLDTDGGLHPQNLFRLVSRSTWKDASTEVSFRITKTNLSDSPNRNESNGVLLMARYQDSENLYYAGVRDDGQAVIKKKINGTYYTLASVQIFGMAGKYDRDTKPTLLPQNRWMALKMSTENGSDGSVLIRLFLDRENDGSFTSILSARDSGTGGTPLREGGYVGIRTDFKDVEFGGVRIENL